MADIFSAIVGCFGVSSQIDEFVVTPLWNQFRYLFHHNDLIQKLRDEVEKLDNDTASLQLKIDAARKNLEVIHGNVKIWIRTAAAKKAEADTILGAAPEGENGTCLSGTCPNLVSRYSSGKQAKKMTDDVRQLREECGKFGRVSDPAPRTGIETIPPTTSGTSEFETRKRKEEKIMACLRDDTILMIGICGMGGVGKTTMGNKIVKRASKEQLFDETVKAVVSQQANLLKIQQQIAGALCLKLEEEKSESVIANQLHERLSNQKRVLLFLDDVWERLDLGELGIPAHCKIILTSRDQDVCIQMMTTKDATEILSLDGLSTDESWVLFREKSGSVVDEPGLRPLAVDVAKECKGLPLALTTVGRAMREKTSKADWEDALLQLRRAAPTNIRGVNKYVYQPLKLSYDALESDEARYFFLLCCLFPEDSNFDIERLVHYGVALRIFTATTSIREARNRAHGLVKMLKNCFLLMDADQSHLRHRSVKMHDVVRDMALSIARSGKHAFMVSYDRGLKVWPENDSHCEDITCISLDLGEETIIPKRINYPRLKALDIAGGFEQRKLPESFFDGVTSLRFLNIPHVVSSLSLEKLIDLRVLHLPFYEPRTIPSFSDLVNLEILRLHGPYIEVLPKEVRALTNLKVLNLNESSRLKNIAPGVLSSLFQLEELRLLACPIQWEVGERGSEKSNASLAEVFSLRNLSLLEIWILGLEMIPQDAVRLKKLTSYSITVGGGYSLSTIDEILDEKRMFVTLNERNVGAHAMSALFADVETLYLYDSGTQDIVDFLARQGFQNVKVLRINNLHTRRHLATTTELLESIFRPTCGVFPVLRELLITSMKELEEICHGPLIVGSFSALQHLRIYSLRRLTHLWKDPRGEVCVPNLKWIKIFECTNLKWVFPLSSVAKSLSQLEEIHIEDCLNLEEVFYDERVLEDGVATFHHISFQKLGRMILKNLPKLSTLCKAIDVFEFPSIEFLEIHRSPNLKFFAHQQPFLSNKQHDRALWVGN